MSDAMSAVLTEALKLPPNERGDLMDRLAESLDPPEGFEEATADEFTAELHRRAAELRASPEAGVAWDEVKEMR